MSTASTRAALTALVLTGVLAAAGCSGEPAPTATVTVTAPAPAPSPSVEPTAAPDPDPAPMDAGDPATWVIDYAGIGPFVVGETLGDIEADLPHPPDTCRPGVDTYDIGGLGLTAVSGIDESDPDAPVQVVRMLALGDVDASAAQPRTEAGIGLGSSVADLQAAYPELDTAEGMGGSTVYELLADSRIISFEDLGTGALQIISVSESVGVGGEYCGA